MNEVIKTTVKENGNLWVYLRRVFLCLFLFVPWLIVDVPNLPLFLSSLSVADCFVLYLLFIHYLYFLYKKVNELFIFTHKNDTPSPLTVSQQKIYLFAANNRITRFCWRHSGAFPVNCEHIWHLFYCWRWASKC